MLASLIRQFRLSFAALLAALVLQWLALPMPARADDLAALHTAVENAAARYQAAMAALEKGGREQTAAEVRSFREAWQTVILQFGARPTPPGAEGEDQAGLFMQMDTRIVGALIVIDIGSREAARTALAPIAETLADLSKKTAPADQ
jgi:hypothetical protein